MSKIRHSGEGGKNTVIPAKAGIQEFDERKLDSGFRRNDEVKRGAFFDAALRCSGFRASRE
jgi:hypothetical protein